MSKNKYIHVVYAVKPDLFQVIRVPKETKIADILKAIADFENDASGSSRKWNSVIMPGVFMFKRVRGAKDAQKAIATALDNGLVYRPMKEAYGLNEKYLNQRLNTQPENKSKPLNYIANLFELLSKGIRKASGAVKTDISENTERPTHTPPKGREPR